MRKINCRFETDAISRMDNLEIHILIRFDRGNASQVMENRIVQKAWFFPDKDGIIIFDKVAC